MSQLEFRVVLCFDHPAEIVGVPQRLIIVSKYFIWWLLIQCPRHVATEAALPSEVVVGQAIFVLSANTNEKHDVLKYLAWEACLTRCNPVSATFPSSTTRPTPVGVHGLQANLTVLLGASTRHVFAPAQQ